MMKKKRRIFSNTLSVESVLLKTFKKYINYRKNWIIYEKDQNLFELFFYNFNT